MLGFVLLLAQIIRVPAGLDTFLPVPESNPLTAEKIRLGRQLFFDKRLSRDGSVACATCHDPALAFSDARRLATGIQGRTGARRSPRLINRVYGASFFWDGRAATLEDQVTQPIENPLEMDMKLDAAAARAGVSTAALRTALASYVRTILSGDSPYDRYLAGDQAALDTRQLAGLKLFSGKAGCTACHVGPNLTDELFHNTGAGSADDPGRFAVTRKEQDRGAFRTPSLREAARMPHYMHDGSLSTLEEVIDFYDKGGRKNPNLDPEIRELHLTAEEKAALVSFLKALNGTVRDGL
jgi:cytochrome c peroxidase